MWRLVPRVVSRVLVVAGVLAAVLAMSSQSPAQAAPASQGSIRGTVTSSVSGGPVTGATVTLYQYASKTKSWSIKTTTSTSSTGSYAFTGLSSGSYRVGFVGDPGWVDEYFDGKSTFATADTLVLSNGTTLFADAVLTPEPGTLSGAVTSPDGSPLSGVTVKLYSAAGMFVAASTTAADGTYAFGGLTPDGYKLGFEAGPAWVAEYYDDAPALGMAAVVLVPAGGTADADAALSPAPGAVTGGVTSAAGSPLSGATVKLYGANDVQLGTSVTASDGAYAFTGLTAGEYRVGFEAGSAWIAEYYDDASTLAAATVIAVAPGQTALADAALAPAPGTVAGSVTGPDGSILSDITVKLYTAAGEQVASSVTGTGGAYAFTGLTVGDYKVGFEGGQAWIAEYYNDSSTLDAATAVAVAAGGTAVADASLASAPGALAGTVTSSGGSPLSGIRVDLYMDDLGGYSRILSTYSAADGTYSFGELVADDYKVGFVDESGVYAAEYHGGSTSLAGAAVVTVGAGATVAGVDGILDRTGSISGVFSYSDGSSVAASSPVDAFRLEGDQWVPVEFTLASPGYTFSELPSGTYRVRGKVWDSVDGRLVESWHGGATLETATDIVLAPGQVFTGADIVFPRP